MIETGCDGRQGLDDLEKVQIHWIQETKVGMEWMICALKAVLRRPSALASP